jgi:hypothetical protein
VVASSDGYNTPDEGLIIVQMFAAGKFDALPPLAIVSSTLCPLIAVEFHSKTGVFRVGAVVGVKMANAATTLYSRAVVNPGIERVEAKFAVLPLSASVELPQTIETVPALP